MNTIFESIIYGFILAKISTLILSDTPLGKSFGPYLFETIYTALLFLGFNIFMIELWRY